MNQTKKYFLIFIIFLVCLTVVILVKKNQQIKSTPNLPTLKSPVTTASSLPLSFAFPSPPSVGSIVFPEKISIPTELPTYHINPLSQNEIDTRVFQLLSSLQLASASSRINQNETFSYRWLTGDASASYARNDFIEALSYQRKTGDPTASLSGTLEHSSLTFLEHINSSLQKDFSWKNIAAQTNGFEGLLLDDPTIPLSEFSYELLIQNKYPTVFPNQTTQIASIVVDNRGTVRAFSGFLIHFSFIETSSSPLISFQEIQRRINARESPLIHMTEKTMEPGDTPPSFSLVTIDEIVPAYQIDEKKLLLIPCFLVSGNTNEKNVRLTYLVDALP